MSQKILDQIKEINPQIHPPHKKEMKLKKQIIKAADQEKN